MDDEVSPYDRPRERAQSMARMSKVPSWISVGVVFGMMVGWYLKPEPKLPAVAPVPVAVKPVPLQAEETKLTTIEAVFAVWGRYAVWENDITEIAYWNPGTKRFTEFYEVRRIGDAVYFRSIDRLTRLIIRHGRIMPECPFQFTETEEQYRDWLEYGRREVPAKTAPPSTRGVAVPVAPTTDPSITVSPSWP